MTKRPRLRSLAGPLALGLLAASLLAAPGARAHGPGHDHHGTTAEDPAAAAAAAPSSPADPLAGRFGGPFELVDQDGKTVTDRDFRGRFMLVYFGYTHCVDVCPLDLTLHGAAIDKLGTDASKVVSIFVTVDPARDTPAVLKEFLSGFRTGTVGLTGPDAAIAKMAAAYKVHRRKLPLDSPEAAPLRDVAGAYIVDHGTLTFLMRPDGSFATLIPHTDDPEALARLLQRYVRPVS